MATTTKKELIELIADATGERRVVVKAVVQTFLNQIIVELGKGNRLEFRDFGVFEVKPRRARRAQNPKTLEEVQVPAKRTVKFKPGRLMKQTLEDADLSDIEFEFDVEMPEAAKPGPQRSTSSDGGVPKAMIDRNPIVVTDSTRTDPQDASAS